MTLRTSVVMINPKALIMPGHQPGPYEIGNGAADVSQTRAANTRQHLSFNRGLGFCRIAGEVARRLELRAHGDHSRDTARVAMRHRRDGVAQPLADGNEAVVNPHEGAGLT